MHRRAFLSTSARSAALMIGLCSPALPAQAQVNNLNDAINKAGRQRMLSQRMAKAWLALGQGLVENKLAAKILSDSMALFDRQLVELKAYAPTPSIQTTYEALEGVWIDYKTALVGTAPQKTNASALLGLDAQVLKLAHQGTVQLEAYSGKTVGRLVNMAGRQRMLSQRVAKFYLSQQWGVNYPDALKELNTAKAEFVAALTVLETAPQATPHIIQKLTLARQQWVFFNNALTKLNSRIGAEQRSIEVFATSEHILQVMDQVTGLYSQLS